MKLNTKKCAFGMREGTFLGYKVDADGLRMCPDKVEAVLNIPSPKCLKNVQKLNGKLASLNRFLSKSAEKSLPFFKTLKKCTKKSDFQWIAEAEELIMYLAAAKEATSAVLMTERDGRQVPIYFVIRALQGPEINYTPMEKLILALRFELGEHDIQYRPRTSVKGQILSDFIVERPEDDTLDTLMEDREELQDPWILFTNGSSCIDYSGAGLIITNPKGMEFTYALRFRFNATNNEVEYEALIACLWIAGQMGGKINRRKRDTCGSRRRGAHLDDSEYLTEGILPEEKKKARAVRPKVGRYAVINEVLYKKSFLGPWLRCVGPLQANYVLKEIHEGSCSMHAGPRSVVAKVVRSGYYWPTMHTDTRNLIRESNDCQGLGKVKFLIMAMDYFTKWIEARQVATITGAQVKKFVWDNIVCRFGLPGEIVSDNGKQFRDNPFKDCCEKIMIPAEIGMSTLRTAEVDIVKNNEALGVCLDLLEEKREQATVREERSKAKTERYYNVRVRNTSFRPGDFVYRNIEASHAEDGGKLKPK
nr:reverse transcriptase domain-containing protein [Tanacetum cinerariifolium]